MCWSENKKKSENKNTANEYRYFLELNFVGVNRLIVLLYSNQDVNAKRIKAQRYYLPKGIIKNDNVIINGKNIFGQPIDSDVKRYQEIRKMTTGYGKYYTTECLLDYEYVKNHYEIIAADVEKELDADPKTIQEIKLVGQLINPDNEIVDNEFMFVLTILEKKRD